MLRKHFYNTEGRTLKCREYLTLKSALHIARLSWNCVCNVLLYMWWLKPVLT